MKSCYLSKTVPASTQISILNGLDEVIKNVNEKCLSDLVLVDKETLFGDHVLWVGITSETVVYRHVLDTLLCRIDDLMFRNNVVCFARPVVYNFDFDNKVINLLAEFD